MNLGTLTWEVEGGNTTFSKEAMTDASETYRVEVDRDHEEELCEVVLVKSSREDCDEINSLSHLYQVARISVTANNGIVSSVQDESMQHFLKNRVN